MHTRLRVLGWSLVVLGLVVAVFSRPIAFPGVADARLTKRACCYKVLDMGNMGRKRTEKLGQEIDPKGKSLLWATATTAPPAAQIVALEAQHRRGYARRPVTDEEFSGWAGEQAWDAV